MEPYNYNKKVECKNISIAPVLANIYQLLSIKIWGSLPSVIQRSISKWYTCIYEKSWSKYLIKPYCWINYRETNYLNQFVPPNNKDQYYSFQDFFIREFKKLPIAKNKRVWPCEGILCHLGKIEDIQYSNVKGDRREVHSIFGIDEIDIPKQYVFSNIFLHNKNYHRIHAPVSGTIRRIQKIKGDLIILRPWIYPQNPSIPAFRNERVNIDIEDESGKRWFLSIVGGPAVGTIELSNSIRLNTRVSILQELAVFYLGSTCCMAAPFLPRTNRENTLVWLGQTY